jgi:hypothetical protein
MVPENRSLQIPSTSSPFHQSQLSYQLRLEVLIVVTGGCDAMQFGRSLTPVRGTRRRHVAPPHFIFQTAETGH